ncbi:MAG: (2Fe-2S)-binding protein [Candidatus Aminicenantes bacterium]|nr:MAG: (2Fe-2S)-binding protein [Candidatus Aminicenantes bacterium]
MVLLKINNKEVKVNEGTTILEAARSIGVNIPTLCHHEAITPYGACRLCTVEVESGGRKRLLPSCTSRADPGMEIITDSASLRAGRRMILELLLAECPEVKIIRKLAEEAGIKQSRFSSKQPQEQVSTDLARGTPGEGECILCGLCIRVCDEIVKASAIGFEGRGGGRKVVTPFDTLSEYCRACGACSFVCPTGAIKMEAEIIEERLKKLDTTERPCRYMLMGIVPYKICPNEYRCHICEVDQEYEDIFGMHPVIGSSLAEARQ